MEINKQIEANSKAVYVPWYRGKYTLMLAGAACIILAASLIWLYLRYRNYVYTDNAIVDGEKISIGAKYSGKISKLFVKAGDIVHKGEPLIELDGSELSAREKQAQADVLDAGEKEKLCSVNLEKAQGDFRRTELEFKNGIIPVEQYDHSGKELAALSIQKSIAAAQLASAKAQLDVIRAQLNTVNISAPDDGVVAKKWFSVGDVVQPGQAVFTIYNLRDVDIVANVEESDFRNVRVGQKAIISLDAYPGHDFHGTVSSLGPNTASEFAQDQTANSTGDFTKLTQYIPVRILLNDIKDNAITGPLPVLPGMSAEVRLKVAH
jgi:membrane fusion protein (multidrug efflux system)